MIAVACGMEDDEAHNIDKSYASHKLRHELEGLVVMSEFDFINRVVIRREPLIPPIRYSRSHRQGE